MTDQPDQIIRKTDFVNWKGDDPNRHGGVVTLVMELDPNRRRMKLGFSFCSPEDQFIKKEGLKYAHERLRDCPIEIPVLYRADHAAGEVLKALCIRDWSNLEQVTTLEIHTDAWRKAVPSWAKKWYRRYIIQEPQTPLERMVEALEDWKEDMIVDFSKAGGYATSRLMARFQVQMMDEFKAVMLQGLQPPGAEKAPESPKDKVH